MAGRTTPPRPRTPRGAAASRDVKDRDVKDGDAKDRDVGERRAVSRLLLWALRVDQARCLRVTRRLRRAHPEATDRELAELLIATYARRGAVAGFVAGLATNPVLALPSAVADVAALLRFYANLSACVGCLASPDYFSEPDWEADALVMLVGRRAVSRVMQGVAVEGVKRASRELLRRQVGAAMVRVLQRGAPAWLATKVTQRALASKLVPVVGGLVGGAWNYLELRSVGRRLVRYHFDGGLVVAPSEGWARQKRAPRAEERTKS